jgi:hypothetical protein
LGEAGPGCSDPAAVIHVADSKNISVAQAGQNALLHIVPGTEVARSAEECGVNAVNAVNCCAPYENAAAAGAITAGVAVTIASSGVSPALSA